MKRMIPLLPGLVLLAWVPFWLGAGDPESSSPSEDAGAKAAAIAAQQAFEERYKQLNADYQNLLAAQEVFQEKLSGLRDQMKSLRNNLEDQHQRFQELTNEFVTHEQMNQLVETIQKVDRKRVEDRKAIMQGLKEIEKIARTPAPVPEPEPIPEPSPTSSGSSPQQAPKSFKGYEYTVQPGDHLTAIIKAYRDEGVDVTLDQVKEANPDLNPDLVRPGQVIRIPDPSLN
jgi:nucleoid-associated protein YgaU